MNFYNYSRTSDVFTVYEFDFFSSLYNVKSDVTIFDTTIQFIFTKTITVEKIKNTTTVLNIFLIKKRTSNKFNHTLAINFFPRKQVLAPLLENRNSITKLV